MAQAGGIRAHPGTCFRWYSHSTFWCFNFNRIVYHILLNNVCLVNHLSQLMRLWDLSHRRPVKAHVSLCIRAVSSEPSLFAHMKYGIRQSVRPNIGDLAPLRMRVGRMGLRRTKSTIISWDGSFHFLISTSWMFLLTTVFHGHLPVYFTSFQKASAPIRLLSAKRAYLHFFTFWENSIFRFEFQSDG